MSFWEMLVDRKKMPGKIKVKYLNLYKLTLSQLFFDGFWTFERFPETLEKYTRFPKFTLLFSISYVCINGKAMWN